MLIEQYNITNLIYTSTFYKDSSYNFRTGFLRVFNRRIPKQMLGDNRPIDAPLFHHN